MNFSGWVLSIVGVVVLALVVDIVLPEGQTNKYIKSIFAIITVFVVVSPLTQLFGGHIELNLFNNVTDGVVLDANILDSLWQLRADDLEKKLMEIYANNNIEIEKVEVLYVENFDEFQIEKIEINVNKSVIANEDKNINIKEKIKQVTVDSLSISENKVFINE